MKKKKKKMKNDINEEYLLIKKNIKNNKRNYTYLKKKF